MHLDYLTEFYTTNEPIYLYVHSYHFLNCFFSSILGTISIIISAIITRRVKRPEVQNNIAPQTILLNSNRTESKNGRTLKMLATYYSTFQRDWLTNAQQPIIMVLAHPSRYIPFSCCPSLTACWQYSGWLAAASGWEQVDLDILVMSASQFPLSQL